MSDVHPRTDRRRSSRCSAEPAAAAVLCDLDGTLAPIVERPELAARPRRRPGRARPDRRPLRADRRRHRPPGDRRPRDRRPREAHLHRQPRIRAAAPERARRRARRPSSAVPRPRRPRSSPPASTRPSSTPSGCGSRTRARSSRCTGAAPPTRPGAAGAGRADRRRGRRGAGLVLHRGRKVLELRPAGRGQQGHRDRVAAARQRGRRSRSTPATTGPTSTPSPASTGSRPPAGSPPPSGSAWRRPRARPRSPRSRTSTVEGPGELIPVLAALAG